MASKKNSKETKSSTKKEEKQKDDFELELENDIVDLLKKDKDIDIEVGFLADINANPTRWLDTGSYAWNWLSSGSLLKGLPYGRVIEIYGESGTGKSLMGSQIAGKALLDGAVVLYFDIEQALDENFVRRLGADPSRIVSPQGVSTIETFDKTFDKVVKSMIAKRKAALEEGTEPRPLVVILDSLAQLSSKQEMENPDKNDMTKHRKIRSFFRRYMHDCAEANVLFVAINQVYEDINKMYGDKRVSSGGKGLTYSASIRFLVNNPSKINKEVNGQKVLIGSDVNISTSKNRLSIPHRSVNFTSYFASGVDQVGGLLDLLKKYGLMKTKGPKYQFPKLLPKVVDPKTNREKNDLITKEEFAELVKDPVNLEKIDKILRETVEEEDVRTGNIFAGEDADSTIEDLDSELDALEKASDEDFEKLEA